MEIAELEELGAEMRKTVLRMTNRAGMGHVGGSLSEIEILTALYFSIMRIDPANPRWKNRDRFILSKGHASPGYYTVLAYRGFFPLETLNTFDSCGTILQSHPDMHKCPGVDYSTGSLGQGISVALGMAVAAGIYKKNHTVFVLVGDGEAQEGQVWEALMWAAANWTKHLVIIFDANNVQLAGKNTCGTDADALLRKLRGFDMVALEADGHDFASLLPVMKEAVDLSVEGPIAIVARTVKGKGISFMEGKFQWHGKAPDDAELVLALAEITASRRETQNPGE
ncbi:MAG: transketolase [Treponema sp.]|jgi:transketolase|nr:transketolase [Treponema sp.]